VYYHGTNMTAANLTRDYGFFSSHSTFGYTYLVGVGMTKDIDVAKVYAGYSAIKFDSAPAIMEVNVPDGKWFDAAGRGLGRDLYTVVAEAAGINIHTKLYYRSISSNPPLTAFLLGLGFDGIIIDSTTRHKASEHIWLKPTSLKLARTIAA